MKIFEEQLNKFSDWYDSYENKPSKSNLMGYFVRKNKEMFEAGQKSGMKGKIFSQVRVTEELNIPSEIHEKIFQAGILKGRGCKQDEINYYLQQGKESILLEVAVFIIRNFYNEHTCEKINKFLNKLYDKENKKRK